MAGLNMGEGREEMENASPCMNSMEGGNMNYKELEKLGAAAAPFKKSL